MPHHYRLGEPLPTTYQHIYLSPHFDDAALSCGGAIARAATDGQQVLVINVCSGQPAADSQFTPFAQENHRRWGLAPDAVVAQRLNEDIQALETLGADSVQCDLLDAIYRMPTRYYSNETLFGALADDDPLPEALFNLIGPLLASYPQAILYAPLAVGDHVDHQAAFLVGRRLAQAGLTVAFYEDLPYALTPQAVQMRLAAVGGQATLSASLIAIDEQMTRKISAVEAYASQIGTLFGSLEAMAEALTTYARELRPHDQALEERIWLIS